MLHLATSTSSSLTPTEYYVALVLIMIAAGATVPGFGSPFVAAEAVLASQGTLSLPIVIACAIVGGIIGGIIGYWIGGRWGEQLMLRPGRSYEKRVKTLEQGRVVYAKWGPLAVFFIPAIVAGIAEMRFLWFVIFYSIAVIFYQFLTALPAYGVGQAASGGHTTSSITTIVIGVVLLFIAFRLYKRYRGHRAESSESADAAAGPEAAVSPPQP
jgi:membrane protein DedA with SNARE-associated domain